MDPTEQLAKVIDYLADDLSEQALKAHLDGKPAVSEALYGFAAACKRANIDVLGGEKKRRRLPFRG